MVTSTTECSPEGVSEFSSLSISFENCEALYYSTIYNTEHMEKGQEFSEI